MAFTPPPSRTQAVFAYVLSALTTLLWLGCVIPGGKLADPTLLDDLATPMHREALLLVPGLLLLTVLPVGFTLARREEGLLAVLASTDAFVALYAGIVLTSIQTIQGPSGVAALALLFTLAVLSGVEAWRCLRAARQRGAVPRALRGARLALCILVLMVPPQFLLEEGTERASWLGPFVFVALSAAGARLARTGRGLRLTAGLLQLLLAVHVLITVQYTLFEATEPAVIERVTLAGQLTRGVAAAVLLAAVLQCVGLLRGVRGARLETVAS